MDIPEKTQDRFLKRHNRTSIILIRKDGRMVNCFTKKGRPHKGGSPIDLVREQIERIRP